MGEKTPNKKTDQDSISRAQIEEKQATIVIARDRAQLELNGLANQLFVLDQLLNPPPDEPDKASENGVPMEDGKI